MAEKAKLHELLAVEKDKEQAAAKVISEGLITFTKKSTHFTGSTKRLEMFDDARRKEEEAFKENRELVTTVQQKLNFITREIANYWDVVASKEATNQKARADIIVDGQVFKKDVPVGALLGFETKLAKIRDLYAAVPTLEPGVKWIPDPNRGAGVYVAADNVVRQKTEKVHQHKIMVPATDKHPAQVHEWTEDRPVGQYIETKISGEWTVARKSVVLGRIDSLISAVKKARMRANMTEVEQLEVSKEFFDFIHAE